MTQRDIANYYCTLTNGEKGRFTAFQSVSLGGTPHTWQQKILSWSKNILGRPISPPVEKELQAIVQQGRWK